jgi:hypothetical protein
MVTEEEVRAYGYRPVLFGDGKGVFAQVWASTNSRVWPYIHSKRGSSCLSMALQCTTGHWPRLLSSSTRKSPRRVQPWTSRDDLKEAFVREVARAPAQPRRV